MGANSHICIGIIRFVAQLEAGASRTFTINPWASDALRMIKSTVFSAPTSLPLLNYGFIVERFPDLRPTRSG